jgi:hypothetical protein
MALIQSIMVEMFVGGDAVGQYTGSGRYIARFPACWSRGPEEKVWFSCVVWGNVVRSDKPSAEELGKFAVWAAENVKEGDRILVRGRIEGTKEGTVSLWSDKSHVVHASYLDLVVMELSITQPKSERPLRPAPAAAADEGDAPLSAAPVPVPIQHQGPVKPSGNPFSVFRKS